MDVSVVIVNYNTYKLTVNCIESVIKFTKELMYEIILVDNASSEIEEVPFEKLFPSITVIREKSNLGFAGGNNAGIKYARGTYILLLNSDTLLIENSISITCQYMKQHPKAAVVSAKLIFPDGRHQSVAQRLPSIKYQLFELLRVQKLIGPERGGKLLLGSFFHHNSNVVADWVWGAYFMFPKSILMELPGQKLDDGYFMYAEDMQWCLDFRKIGYEVHYCSETRVIHLMGGSSGAKQSLMKKNNEVFLKRNYLPIHRILIKGLHKILA